MKSRLPLILAAVLLLAVLAGLAWRQRDAAVLADGAGSAELPLPPVPPRIAEGADYDHCMAMLTSDPQGANSFADAWIASGGGDGALHCSALAKVALGDVSTGAALLERLAANSKAPGVVRAAVYNQADQAWLMAGDADRALAAASLALGLSDEDPDLLIQHAVAAASLNRDATVVGDLTRALELDPQRADARVLRAAAYRHLGQLDQAEDDVERALTQNPDDAEAFLERGILRERKGDRRGARSDWVRAETLWPDTPTSDLAEQNLALLEAGPEQR